ARGRGPGPGGPLATGGIGMLGRVPPRRATGARGAARTQSPSVLRDLRDGWSAFAARRWLWATTCQYSVILAAWYGSFDVLGPVGAPRHLGGAAARGPITAADAGGLIIGGGIAVRVTVPRPLRFAVLIGGARAPPPPAPAALLPLPLICVAAVGLGISLEVMMVQWTVTMARNVPADLLARVSSYDIIGSVSAMPLGALLAGPIAAAVGVSATQYGAAALIVVASALTMLVPEVRHLRAAPDAGAQGTAEVPAEGPAGVPAAPAGAKAA